MIKIIKISDMFVSISQNQICYLVDLLGGNYTASGHWFSRVVILCKLVIGFYKIALDYGFELAMVFFM